MGETPPSHLDNQFASISRVLDKDSFTTEEATTALSTLESIRDEASKQEYYRVLFIRLAIRLAKKLELVRETAATKKSLMLALKAANSITGDTNPDTEKLRSSIIEEMARIAGKSVDKDEL
jgi:hypothetical protein